MKWNSVIIERNYRYLLPLKLSGNGGELAVIQINPSLADGIRLDATAGKVKCWAEEHGYSALYLLNFFAIINPKQEAIERKNYLDIVGPRNDKIIKSVVGSAKLIIATGKPSGILKEFYDRRLNEMTSLLGNRSVFHVGALTKDGFPRHGRSWNKGNRIISSYTWPAKPIHIRSL